MNPPLLLILLNVKSFLVILYMTGLPTAFMTDGMPSIVCVGRCDTARLIGQDHRQDRPVVG
jgi:hypothetical protein